jgi:hypothetical protein
MNGLSKGFTIFIGGLISIAILATLVSKKSNTSSVVNSGGSAISNTLSAAQGSTG